MIGCTVKPTSRSGWRGIRSRLRFARTSVSETVYARLVTPLPPRPRRCGRSAGGRHRRASGCTTTRSSTATPAASSRRTASAIAPFRSRSGTRTVESWSDGLAHASAESASTACSPCEPSSEADLQLLAAGVLLELARRALGDHAPVVDDDDPVGEPVGLVQVLGGEQDRRPSRDQALDRVPERQPAARIEPGGRLVEKQHRRASDKRRREVEPAAHAAGIGPHEPAAGIRRGRTPRAALAHARARRAGPSGRAGRPSPGSRSR